MRPRTAQPSSGSAWPRTRAVPACGRSRRGEHAQQRRLARPVGAEDHERRARRQRQRDVLQRDPLAVAARQPGELNGWRGCHLRCPAWRRRARAPAPARGRAARSPSGCPGKLTISVWPATPATPRLSMPIGVCCVLTARIASAMPGRLAGDDGPGRLGRDVVERQAGAAGGEDEGHALVDVVVQAVLDEGEVVGHDLHGHDLGARVLGEVGEQRARGSSASRRETLVETVMTTVRTAPDDSRGWARRARGAVVMTTRAIRPRRRPRLAGARRAGRRRAAHAARPARRRCREWGGEDVVALACDPAERAAADPPAPRRRRGRPVRARHRAALGRGAAAGGRDGYAAWRHRRRTRCSR